MAVLLDKIDSLSINRSRLCNPVGQQRQSVIVIIRVAAITFWLALSCRFFPLLLVPVARSDPSVTLFLHLYSTASAIRSLFIYFLFLLFFSWLVFLHRPDVVPVSALGVCSDGDGTDPTL